MASQTIPQYQPYCDVLDYKFKSPPYTAISHEYIKPISKPYSSESFPQFGSDLPSFISVPTEEELDSIIYKPTTFISIPTAEELASIIRYDPPPPPYSSHPPATPSVFIAPVVRRSRKSPPTMLGSIYENGGMAPDVPLRNPRRNLTKAYYYAQAAPTLAGPGVRDPNDNEYDEYEGPRGEKLKDARLNKRVEKKGIFKKSR